MWRKKPNSGGYPVSHVQTWDKELAICRIWTQEQRWLCIHAQMSHPWARSFPAGQTCLDLSAKVVPLFISLFFFWVPSQRVCQFLATPTLCGPPNVLRGSSFGFSIEVRVMPHGWHSHIADIPTCAKRALCRISLKMKSATRSFVHRERLNLLKPTWTAFSGQIGFGLRNNWCLCWPDLGFLPLGRYHLVAIIIK